MQYVPDFLVQHARRLQPDLDEVTIQQRVITVVPTIFSVVISILLASLFFAAAVPSVAVALLVVGLVQSASFLLGILRPQHTVLALSGFALAAIGANLYIHLESGGFTSGVWSLAWLPLVPLVVYFVGGRRVGLAALGLVLLAFVVAALLEPRVSATQLVIPTWLKLVYSLVALFSASLVSFMWAEFLISQLEVARRQTDALLLSILPRPIAARLKAGEKTIADSYDAVTVLFADIVDFTTMSAQANPVDVVNKLNDVFSDFDDLAAKHGLEKIKTIGDAYMVAGGLPAPRPDHVAAVAAFAVDMIDAIGRHRSWTGAPIRLRVGINTGPIVAGVIGRQKFIYDLWGDAVNVASRMESNGVANQIQVTAAVKAALDGRYVFEERPPIDVKGKGPMVTYLMRPVGSA